jgi:uncharacterized membrane-anchored protein
MHRFNIKNHAQRFNLNNEVHARPYQIMCAPLRVSHLALMSGDREQEVNAIGELCDRFGITRPNPEANFFITDFPLFQLRWERHTEFSTYTVYESTVSEVAFKESALAQLPVEWIEKLPGEVVTMVNLELIKREKGDLDLAELSKLFSSNTVVGSEVSGGSARVWTDFQIHADGFNRVLVDDRGLRQRQAGRLVQRILEIETYRIFAMLALPLARQYSLELAECDKQLEAVTQRVSLQGKRDDEQILLDELSRIAASVEHIAATTGYRFSATNAYYGLVRRRISELREKRIEGAQLFDEFMERRLLPAVRTCESVSDRVHTLSDRIARVSDLLRTRIDIHLEAQNRDLLRSMDQRAAMQLRLQEMVEGLSVVVLTYYSVGLISYLLKGLKQLGIGINVDLVVGISIPLVVIAVYLGLRFTRHRLDKHSSAEKEKN